MKATGVIRRIDELGRIVIPKEIRKKLKIRDGESIEIFTDNLNQIILKKYSFSEDYTVIIESYVESIYETLKKDILITDRDKFISGISELKKDCEQKDISDFLIRTLDRREVKRDKGEIELCNGKIYSGNYIIYPIISSLEPIGSIILLSKTEEITKENMDVIQVAANFLGKYIEN
ncbi:MAG: AbrB/MazE/SpoVT family DNA-binding domain-containing protein [Firmicutes bacterium]|nr:AbrB/MazE/SpoVT family DNA-binding domain-containing protein [Bacillota bacterium]